MKQKKFYDEVPIWSLPDSVLLNASLMVNVKVLRTALVVDDDRKNADGLVNSLRSHGYLAEAAYSAEEGLEKAREFRPGLIVSDVGLPGMDGLTMVDTVSTFLPDSKIVLICETLPGNMEIRSWSVLKKPVRTMELLAVIKTPADLEN